MNIADLIYQRRSKSADPEWIADILRRLVWLMDDNGSEIHEAMIRWMESESHEQALIALLYCDEVFPYKTRDEMVAKFSGLQSRFPDLKPQCDKIIQQWDKQFPNGIP